MDNLRKLKFMCIKGMSPEFGHSAMNIHIETMKYIPAFDKKIRYDTTIYVRTQ